MRNSLQPTGNRITAIVTAVLLLTVAYCLLPTASFAADVSPNQIGASPSAAMQAKIKQLQTEIASKAAQLESQVSQKLQNRVYSGPVKAKSDSSLTLAAENGSKIVSLNQFTSYQDQTGRWAAKTSLKNISADDFVIALGDIDDNDVLTAKEVIKATAPAKLDLAIIYGQLTAADTATITVQGKDGSLHTFKTTSDTTYQSKQEKSASADEFLQGSTVIAVGEKQEDNTLTARFIYLVSGPVSPTPAKPASATSGAQQAATATPTPKLKAK